MRYPIRPAFIYPLGHVIHTKHGMFRVVERGAADLIWRQWAWVTVGETDGR